MRGNKKNPLTGLQLNSTKIYPNICIRNIIQKMPKKETKDKIDLS